MSHSATHPIREAYRAVSSKGHIDAMPNHAGASVTRFVGADLPSLAQGSLGEASRICELRSPLLTLIRTSSRSCPEVSGEKLANS